MYTQIIDDKTFKIGETVFEVGDPVTLTGEENHTLLRIQELDKQKIDLQQRLVDLCHATKRNFVPEGAPLMNELRISSLELSFLLNDLLNRVQTRLGGLLPLDYEEEYKGLKIRPKTPGDVFNFTLPVIKHEIGYDAFEPLRDVAVEAANRESVTLDLGVNRTHKVQPVTAVNLTADKMLDSIEKILKDKVVIPNFVAFFGCPDENIAPNTITHLVRTDPTRREEPPQVRQGKIAEFGSKMKPTSFAVVVRGSHTKDSVTTKVGIFEKIKDDKISKTVFELTATLAAPREVTRTEITEEAAMAIAGSEVYERVL